MKIGTIITIYSINNRVKNQGNSSNGFGDRVHWVFTPYSPCHRVHSKKVTAQTWKFSISLLETIQNDLKRKKNK